MTTVALHVLAVLIGLLGLSGCNSESTVSIVDYGTYEVEVASTEPSMNLPGTRVDLVSDVALKRGAKQVVGELGVQFGARYRYMGPRATCPLCRGDHRNADTWGYRSGNGAPISLDIRVGGRNARCPPLFRLSIR